MYILKKIFIFGTAIENKIQMRHGSLFNGIGGFQIAAALMNWENVFSCEIDDFCNRVTKYHFPECKQYYDIKKTSFREYKGKIDILTGGFPCQPFSIAGKRLGTDDDRNLWAEMYRAVQEIQPRWVVAENSDGIISWNGGVAFEQVLVDLETESYEVQPFVLPAAGVNAPHRRNRVFFIAYNPNARVENMRQQRENEVHGFEFATNSDDNRCRNRKNKQKPIAERKSSPNNCGSGENGLTSNSDNQRGKLFESSKKEGTQNSNELFARKYSIPDWSCFPTQSPICRRNDGFSTKLDNITFSSWRRQAIKAYGNAVVVPLVLQIFKSISECENLEK